MLTPDPSGDVSDAEFVPLGSARGFHVNSDQSFTPVVTVTAQSKLYLVVYTWNMKASTWDSDQRYAKIAEKTQQVNAICAHPHVQGFRTEQDQDASQVLYFYAVITVGTDDESVTDDVRWRMDSIFQSGVFNKIDATWDGLVKIGAE